MSGLTGSFVAPNELDEGAGIDYFAIADSATSRVDLSGELWSRPIRASVTPSADEGKLASALVFGSPLWSQLSEPEQMTLALHGGAVSPVTSYLAIEPGVRPSNEGLDWSTIGLGGGVGFGQGSGMGLARFGSSHAGPDIDKNAWLAGQLQSFLRRCAPSSSEVDARLESTLDEVVDVGVVELGPTRDAKAEACLREAIWNLTLPAITFKDALEAHHVKVKRAAP